MAAEHRIETPQHQMWGGRFALGPSEALQALNRSLPVDHRLWPQDVAASKAWVHALGRAGVLTAAEEAALLEGLDRVAERLADGAAVGAPDEDIHTLVERLLYEEVGSAAGKLHTGRSRNDQVATDLRLWTLGAIDQLDADLAQLGSTLVARARDGMDDLLPGTRTASGPSRCAGPTSCSPTRSRWCAIACGSPTPVAASPSCRSARARSRGRASPWTGSS